MTNSTVKLPNGNDFWLQLDLTEGQASGILVRPFASSLLLIAKAAKIAAPSEKLDSQLTHLLCLHM